VSTLPIRLRLTLAFALAMAAVLAATGAVLYFRLASSLDVAINEGLEARAGEIGALVRRDRSGLNAALQAGTFDQDERFVQVLDRRGRIVAATPGLMGQPLIGVEELTRMGANDTLTVERDEVRGVEGPARLLARSIDSSAGARVVVVGLSLEERNDALERLLGELFIVGPVALLLASLLAYALARSALRPVEAMRVEAAAISAAEPSRRLSLPKARDEISRLADTLNKMLARLESALTRERNFVADASHELRTPLALLKSELELALRRPRSAAELEQALRSAAHETDRLVRLAEDLLVLARSDQGRLPLRRIPVSAAAILAQVAERFRPEAERAGRAILVDTPDRLRVVGDDVRLEQALGNLIDNALRHGGGAIRLSALEKNGAVELHVADEGAGLPPEFVARAFERFSRANEARSGEGAGLGLALVEVIARAHDGSTHAANRDGGGADVWLSIPQA
jgi:two-component system, OmpR family, sensor kinase